MKRSSTTIITILTAFFLAACSPKNTAVIEAATLKGTTSERTVSNGSATFKYRVTEFEKPVPVPLIKRNEASYSTPEDAVASHLSAIRTLDYTWFRMSWDTLSLAKLDERGKQENVTSATWKARWEKFVDAEFELTHRIDYSTGEKSYTLIAYQWVAKFPKFQAIKPHCVALRKEGNRWYMTLELEADKGYNFADELIQSGKTKLVK